MNKHIERIILGAKKDKEYGKHPGIFPLVSFFVIFALIAGFKGILGWLLFISPIFLFGCLERGKGIQKRIERERNKNEKEL